MNINPLETPLMYAKLAMTIIILGISGYLVWNYQHMGKKIVTLEATSAKAVAELKQLRKDTDALSATVVEKLKAEQIIRVEREVIHSHVAKAKANVPKVNEYLTTRIPDELRSAYRKDTGKPVSTD